MITLAKALYDNTADCLDELAFRRGDIVMVMEQNVAGTSGWWMCSLYGRQGLAPANRLHLLPRSRASTGATNLGQDKPPELSQSSDCQNIYQIPSPSRAQTELLYTVPSTPPSASSGPSAQTSEEYEDNKLFNMVTSPIGQLYDVPGQVRRGSLFPVATTPRMSGRNHSLVPMSELQNRFDSPESCENTRGQYINAVPPVSLQDSNYDIPVPLATETQKMTSDGYNTFPIPRKPEWIYDIPVSPNKQSPSQAFLHRVPPRPMYRQLYDNNPAPVQRAFTSPSLYTIPKFSSLDSPPTLPPRTPVASRRDSIQEESVYDLPSFEDPLSDQIPLECRTEPADCKRNCLTMHNSPGSQDLLKDGSKNSGLSALESQRISTASFSSSSSCDSLALTSSSPEPQREVNLRQDEVCRKLLDLQDGVCKAVPRIMEFVCSGWRRRHHLEKHLKEIREAAVAIASSLSSFLNFALDIKGNAQHLTDANLQARLYKQLCDLDNSGVILQQTVSALNEAGWPLEMLSQEAGQASDQLERFVMVARTIPEDLKRLVSMINANGKLLFKAPEKKPELPSVQSKPRKSPVTNEEVDVVEDDYVELQTKTDFEDQQKVVQKDPNEKSTAPSNHTLVSGKSGADEPRSPSLSEHCRLYFGALQKAIGGFVGSLRDGHPPEKFISQSKLIIMVGQRLVNTLCREAHRGENSQSLLNKSNHLCALLKQLAVATKKAALHFPDRQAVHEAQEFAKELAQKAQHFRLSLDL